MKAGLLVSALAALGLLASWVLGASGDMVVSFSAYSNRPVVLTRVVVNGQTLGMTPLVIAGKADTEGPGAGSGRQLRSYPRNFAGKMTLDLTWVELTTGQGYSAQITLPARHLRRADGAVAFMPVFGPAGLLHLTADPDPVPGAAPAIRDVLRLCASRDPAADKDFTANPTEIPGLSEALAAMQPFSPQTECSER